MTVCQFFLNGSCRFGSKCYNEHIDIKQQIKPEIDAALNGNQWPLSCFGPFKDRPCIPNFIEDQSFEEVRCNFYEARNLGGLEQFCQQFYNAVMNAKNKMKTLETMTPEIMTVVLQLYEAGDSDKKAENLPQQATNMFGTGMALGGQQQQPTQQPANVFGQSAFGSQNKPPVGNVFGAGAVNNAASIFGGGNTAPQSGAAGIFGGASQTTAFNSAPKMSIFGNSAINQIQPASIFGGGTQQPSQPSVFSQPSAGGNIFGQNTFATSDTNVSPFSLGQISSQPAAQSGGNIFGKAGVPAPNPTSVFGGGQPTGFAAQPQTTLFSQPPIFSQPQTQPNPPQNLFQTPAGAFGTIPTQPVVNPSPFGVQTAPQGMPFGQAGGFGSTQPQQQSSAFQSQPQQTFQPTPSPFGPAIPVTTSPFTQQPQQPLVGSPFGGGHEVQTTPFSGFGSNEPAAQMQPQVSVYGKLSDLSEEQIYWYKADSFEIGKIPTVPPPREFC